jgi:hypothetical protein
MRSCLPTSKIQRPAPLQISWLESLAGFTQSRRGAHVSLPEGSIAAWLTW